MAVFRGEIAASMLPDAIVLDLGDLARQGRAIMERAEAEAETILDKTRIERERLLSGASEQGFEQGRAAGFAQGVEEGRRAGHAEAIEAARDQAAQLVKVWEDSLAAFESARAAMLDAAREDVVRFAIAFAERVTHRLVELDARAIEPLMAKALSLVMDGSTISVRVAAEDAELARAVIGPIMERLGHSRDAEIVEDTALERGACLVRTKAGSIDASIQAMTQRMVQHLLPGVQTRESARDQTNDEPASNAMEAAEHQDNPAPNPAPALEGDAPPDAEAGA